jgi:hypothetical protein
LSCDATHHGWEHALKDSANNIENISKEPDNDELDGEGIRVATLEVLDNLRGENDHWR